VELLVVISIIGMLMALLLPAVQQAREAGRTNTCRNYLNNISLAVLNFESAKRQYPGFREPMEVTFTAGSATTDIPVSWIVVIFPYLERNDIYNLYRSPQQAAAAGMGWPPEEQTGQNCFQIVLTRFIRHIPFSPLPAKRAFLCAQPGSQPSVAQRRSVRQIIATSSRRRNRTVVSRQIMAPHQT
jgi:type II secretory pathway pseudopilin PulG